MNSKHTNILRASVRVVITAFAAVLAWIIDVLVWFLNSLPERKSSSNEEFHVSIEDGFLKSKGGGQETIMEVLDDPRDSKD